MNIILATDENWAIGKDGGLLCHLPGDLKFFKEMTLGKTVVMGRRTLESLPNGKPLPNRNNIVLSRNKDLQVERAKVVHTREELNKVLESIDTEDVYIIGGGQIYRDFLDQCSKCYITKIYHSFEADTYFVNLDQLEDQFSCRPLGEPCEEGEYKYQFFEYVRK